MPLTRECDVESLQDFSRYYSSGWVGYHTKNGTIKPAHVGRDRGDGVLARTLAPLGDDYTYEDMFELSFRDLKNKIDFGRPEVGMMEDGPTVIYMSYSTPRQAHKGFRTRELILSEFNSADLRPYYAPNRPARTGVERHDWVWSAFNPTSYSFANGYALLQDGKRVGVPISRLVGLYTLTDSEVPLVAYKRWNVGYAPDPKTIRIHKKYLDYSEDLAAQTGAEVQLI